jgi:hypothetical protein
MQSSSAAVATREVSLTYRNLLIVSAEDLKIYIECMDVKRHIKVLSFRR